MSVRSVSGIIPVINNEGNRGHLLDHVKSARC